MVQCYDSLCQAMRILYPDIPWQAARFLVANRRPKNHWVMTENQIRFLEKIGAKLGVDEVSPLLIVTDADFHFELI